MKQNSLDLVSVLGGLWWTRWLHHSCSQAFERDNWHKAALARHTKTYCQSYQLTFQHWWQSGNYSLAAMMQYWTSLRGVVQLTLRCLLLQHKQPFRDFLWYCRAAIWSLNLYFHHFYTVCSCVAINICTKVCCRNCFSQGPRWICKWWCLVAKPRGRWWQSFKKQ